MKTASRELFDGLAESDAFDPGDQRHNVSTDAAAVAPPGLRLARINVEVGSPTVRVEWASADQRAALDFQLDAVARSHLLDPNRLLQGVGVDAAGQHGS
jgi:hypothetical protein